MRISMTHHNKTIVLVTTITLLMVLSPLVKRGEGGAGNYKVGHYNEEILDESGVVVDKSTRVGIKHRYYKGYANVFNTSVTSKVMGLVLEDVMKVEGHRVDMMLASIDRTSEIETRIRSGTSLGTGNYIIEVGLGTPKETLDVVVDTGSDLAWTQCKPCSGPNSCYSQKDLIFDPSRSSSYKSVACDAPLCKLVGRRTASGCTRANACEYGIQYLDGSFTAGTVATDTLTVGAARIPSYALGCGRNNEGIFNGFDGLLGFSRDALAFPAQSRSGIFTYCLPSPFSPIGTGFLDFGSATTTATSWSALQFSNSSLYAVPLSSVRVNSRSVTAPASGRPGSVIIIDSGTVITRLDSALYIKVRDAFRQGTSHLATAPSDAGLGLFDTCYKLRVGSEIAIPTVTFVLGGAAHNLPFTPPAASLLYPVDDNGTVCFAFAPIQSDDALSVLGNYQQQGFSFSFDIAHNSLSIKPNAC